MAGSNARCGGTVSAPWRAAGSGPRTTDSRHDLPVAPNLPKQEFAAAAPNRVWLADIAYIPTGEGWPCLAAVPDPATRKIVGRSMRDRMRTEPPLAAMMMAAQWQDRLEAS